MEVKTANKPAWPKDLTVFLFALSWGIVSVVLFVALENKLVSACIVAMGIPLFIMLINKQANIRRAKQKAENNFSQSMFSFCCQDCSEHIASPIKTQNLDGEPILYHCQKCDILWFTGSIDNSSA